MFLYSGRSSTNSCLKSRLSSVLASLGLLLCLYSPVIYAETFIILAPPDVLDDYRLFLGGRTASDVERYDGEHVRFDVVELVLFEQALHAGGFRGELKWVPQKNFKRIVQQVSAGQATAAGNSVWQSIASKADNKFYITDPIVPAGKLETGLFTSAHNKSALAIKDLSQLSQMRIVSNRNWTKSWSWLQSIQVRQLYNHTDWPSMVKMVASNHADIVMAPFPLNADRQNLTLSVDGIPLVPVPGVKLVNGGSRHFVVSQQSVDGLRCFEYLQKGLAILSANHQIERAFVESGVYNPVTQDWAVLGVRPE